MLIPLALGLSAALLLTACTAEAPAASDTQPSPEPELPGHHLTSAQREYYRRLTQVGYSGRSLDQGYWVGPWPGRYFSTTEQVIGVGDGRVDGLEVYLGLLDFSEVDPQQTFLQGMLQEIVAEPATRFEFAQALMHSPAQEKARLWMAESLWRWSLREDRSSSYLWFQLGAVQERLGQLHDADLSYRLALRRQEGLESYSTLMTLANLQRRLRRPASARGYEERAWELAVREGLGEDVP